MTSAFAIAAKLNTTVFPPLYKVKGQEKYCWSIEVSLNEAGTKAYIVSHHGLETGKKVEHKKEVTEGKCGRTVLEQATQEASRKWTNKKEKELYQELYQEFHQEFTSDATTAVVVETHIQVRPMLAQTANFNKTGGYTVPFPAMVQRKYDGIRCIAHCNADGHVVLESRKGTPFTNFPALTAELQRVFASLPKDIYLDGELFTDRVDFETISGLVRSKKATVAVAKEKKLTEKQAAAQRLIAENQVKKGWIDFHVYDMVDTANLDMPFYQRCARLTSIVESAAAQKIKLVETMTVQSQAEIKPLHDQFVSEGFEGIMVRDVNGPYQVNKRSKYLQKYKEFMDEEFKIVGFHEGSGNEKGAVVWDCVTQTGQPFAVRPRGSFDARKEMYLDAAAYIGKQLTVIFQEYSTDGIPRFPVGKAIRVGGI